MALPGHEGKLDRSSRGSEQLALSPELCPDAWDSRVRGLPSALGHTQARAAAVVQGCCDSLSSLKVCQPRQSN